MEIPWFFIGMITSVVTFFLSLIRIIRNYFAEKKSNYSRIILLCSVICAIFSMVAIELPQPEIYTTNADSAFENEIYIKSSFPLTVWYTTIQYEEPKNGEKYTGPFQIQESCVITAKSTFLGLKWSDKVSEDIIIGDDGSIRIEPQEEPGSSIKEIEVAISNHQFFPGDVLSSEYLVVTGTTIYEEQVTIRDYEYEPITLVEGINTIVVTYKNLEASISCNINAPQLEGLSVEYIGDTLYEGDLILSENFLVKGIYENGEVIEISDFSISPQIAENAGTQVVTITVDEISKEVKLEIEEKQIQGTNEGISLFSNCYMDKEADSVMNNVVFDYWDSEQTDVQGLSHEDGLYLFMGDLFNMIQSVGDSWITVTLHYIVNPEYDLSRGTTLSGQFVVASDTMGSEAYTGIEIQVDGETVWNSDENISGSTINPVSYSVLIPEGAAEMTMVFECNALGNGIGVGIILEDAVDG